MTALTSLEAPFLGTNGYPLQPGAVYGPVHSRRYGHSLGINPLPVSYKFCDFDCVYCQYGWTPRPGSQAKKTDERIKSAKDLLLEMKAAFETLKRDQTPVDVMTVAGNGEPTLHPEFLTLMKGLVDLRDAFFPKVRIGILSDASQCHRKDIREGLLLLDDRCMKLDGGDIDTIKLVNKPSASFNFERTLSALKALGSITVQSLFVDGSVSNTDPVQISKWIEAIRQVQPASVQVYTIDRPPADSQIAQVEESKLQAIADQCFQATGIQSDVF